MDELSERARFALCLLRGAWRSRSVGLRGRNGSRGSGSRGPRSPRLPFPLTFLSDCGQQAASTRQGIPPLRSARRDTTTSARATNTSGTPMKSASIDGVSQKLTVMSCSAPRRPCYRIRNNPIKPRNPATSRPMNPPANFMTASVRPSPLDLPSPETRRPALCGPSAGPPHERSRSRVLQGTDDGAKVLLPSRTAHESSQATSTNGEAQRPAARAPSLPGDHRVPRDRRGIDSRRGPLTLPPRGQAGT